MPGSLATVESVAKGLCISSARQSHKLQCLWHQTVGEERTQMQDLTSVFSKVYPYPIFRPLLAHFDFHQLGSNYIMSSIHGKSVYSLRSWSPPAPRLDLTSLLQSDSTAFSPAGLLWATASLRDSRNSPQKSACLHFIPSFLPLLSEVHAAKEDCGLSYRSELQLCWC